MGSLSYVVSKTFGYFFVITNISIIRIGQKAAQQGESKTVTMNSSLAVRNFSLFPLTPSARSRLAPAKLDKCSRLRRRAKVRS